MSKGKTTRQRIEDMSMRMNKKSFGALMLVMGLLGAILFGWCIASKDWGEVSAVGVVVWTGGISSVVQVLFGMVLLAQSNLRRPTVRMRG